MRAGVPDAEAQWRVRPAPQAGLAAPYRCGLKMKGNNLRNENHRGDDDMSSSGAAGARPRVAVLGAGTMGQGMAHSLLRAGFTVDVWNRTPEPAAQLAADGATAHEGLAAAVRHADVVITMVADAAAVNQVAFESGMLAAMRPGAAWSQMSTIGVRATERTGRAGQQGAARRVLRRRPGVRDPRPGRERPAAHPGVRPGRRQAPARAGVRRARPGGQVARRGRGGQRGASW